MDISYDSLPSYDLSTELWAPVYRQHQGSDVIAPIDLPQVCQTDDPPIDVAAGEMSLDAGTLEFLIAWWQTAFFEIEGVDATREAWRAWYDGPRDLERSDLSERMRAALDFWDADHPFMQVPPDRVPDDKDSKALDRLIPSDGWSENAMRKGKNSDWRSPPSTFVQGCDEGTHMGLEGAIPLLYRSQTYGGGSGGGNARSLRGTQSVSATLHGETLWETVWLNVLPLEAWRKDRDWSKAGSRFRTDNKSTWENILSNGVLFPWVESTHDRISPAHLDVDDCEDDDFVHPLYPMWSVRTHWTYLPVSDHGHQVTSAITGEIDGVVHGIYDTDEYTELIEGLYHPLCVYHHDDGDPVRPDGQFDFRRWVEWRYGCASRSQKTTLASKNLESMVLNHYDQAQRVVTQARIFGRVKDGTQLSHACDQRYVMLPQKEDTISIAFDIVDQAIQKVRKKLSKSDATSEGLWHEISDIYRRIVQRVLRQSDPPKRREPFRLEYQLELNEIRNRLMILFDRRTAWIGADDDKLSRLRDRDSRKNREDVAFPLVTYRYDLAQDIESILLPTA